MKKLLIGLAVVAAALTIVRSVRGSNTTALATTAGRFDVT